MSNQNYSRADRNTIYHGGLPRTHRGRAIVRWFIRGVEVAPARDRGRRPIITEAARDAASKVFPVPNEVRLVGKPFTSWEESIPSPLAYMLEYAGVTRTRRPG